jgi:hypothetical protein
MPPQQYMPVPQQPPQNTSFNGMSIAAFIGGLCTGFLGLVFGIIALVQIKARGGRGKGFAITGIALFCAYVVAIVAIAVLAPSGPQRDPNTGQVTSQTTVALDQIKVGDCIPSVSEKEYITITLTPCAQAHKAEVVGIDQVAGNSYPGEATVTQQAENVCPEKLKAYSQTAYDDETLELFYLTPSADTWKTGDRSIVCIVQDSKGDRTTSVKG